jgi:hypothetical protein
MENPRMKDTIETVARAGELPARLRGDLDIDAPVLVSVRPVTANGFTEAFEDGVLEAEQEVKATPFRPAAEIIREFKAFVADES